MRMWARRGLASHLFLCCREGGRCLEGSLWLSLEVAVGIRLTWPLCPLCPCASAHLMLLCGETSGADRLHLLMFFAVSPR